MRGMRDNRSEKIGKKSEKEECVPGVFLDTLQNNKL
jgi:hypothetical protein